MRKIMPFNMLRTIMIIECIVAVAIFFYSPHGYALLRNLTQQQARIESDIIQVRESIRNLEQQLADWEKYPFYKEKYCCEHLQMMHPDATLYYIN